MSWPRKNVSSDICPCKQALSGRQCTLDSERPIWTLLRKPLTGLLSRRHTANIRIPGRQEEEKKDMTSDAERSELAREAKAIVALAFRNGPIEDIHAGSPCPVCNGKPEFSRISDEEMKLIMKNAVNRVYALLCLKSCDPDGYAEQIAFAQRYTARWDDPD